METAAAVFLVTFWLVYVFVILGICGCTYVFQALALQAVAKRRQIEKPWLAWVPVGNMWLLGSISDQYQHVVNGKDRNFRKLLLWLMVGVLAILTLVVTVEMIAIIMAEVLAWASIVMLVFVLVTALVAEGFAIFASVIEYMAIYDYYRSCDPSKAVLFLILSIVTPAYPILLFIVRNQDLGMPPKEEEVPVIE